MGQTSADLNMQKNHFGWYISKTKHPLSSHSGSLSRSKPRSSEVKTVPPYLFRNLRGPAPRHPEGLECWPRPALPPKGRGPRLGVPEAGPCPGHPILCLLSKGHNILFIRYFLRFLISIYKLFLLVQRVAVGIFLLAHRVKFQNLSYWTLVNNVYHHIKTDSSNASYACFLRGTTFCSFDTF